MLKSILDPCRVAVALLLLPMPVGAQVVATGSVSATMPSYGAVLATSPLSPVASGDQLAGTVTLRQNGPWRLEVQLDPLVGAAMGGGVQVRSVVEGETAQVTTEGWLSVASGEGTISREVVVRYSVAPGGSVLHRTALRYRVVAQANER